MEKLLTEHRLREIHVRLACRSLLGVSLLIRFSEVGCVLLLALAFVGNIGSFAAMLPMAFGFLAVATPIFLRGLNNLSLSILAPWQPKIA